MMLQSVAKLMLALPHTDAVPVFFFPAIATETYVISTSVCAFTALSR